jgi:hypothetical protein
MFAFNQKNEQKDFFSWFCWQFVIKFIPLATENEQLSVYKERIVVVRHKYTIQNKTKFEIYKKIETWTQKKF